MKAPTIKSYMAKKNQTKAKNKSYMTDKRANLYQYFQHSNI